MGTYQVMRTPGGGYWVREADAVDLALGAAIGVAGTTLGAALAAARGAASKTNYRNFQQAWTAVLKAKDSENWALVYELAKGFIQHYPQQQAGYEAVADAGARLDLPPAEQLEIAKLFEAHGGEKGEVAALRGAAYFDSEDMASALREANTLVGCGGEWAVIGYMIRARALLWLGDLDQARSDANAAASLMPEANTYALRADVSWARGDLASAETDYTRALRLAQEEALQLLEKRASVYEAQGQIEAARADRQAATDLRPQR
jgi:tetratricopeptide (TPR) repeat protein